VRLRRAARAKFEPSARHHAQLTTAARPGRAASSITFTTPLGAGRIRIPLVSSCTESNATVARRQTTGLRRNVLRCYRIEANRATYEYRCTAGELADVPAIPQAVLRAEGRGVADVSGAIGLVRRVDHRPDIQQRDAPLV